MGRNRKKLSSLFFFLLRIKNSQKSLSSRRFRCCILPKTHSCRFADEIFKTVNSIYFDSQDSFLTFSEEAMNKSFSVTSVSGDFSGEYYSFAVRRLRSDRLFFDPGESSASIMVKAKKESGGGVLFKQSVAMTMDSEDPCRDFRVSMEEMVAANGVKDWEKLVELFVWFLRANGKENHGFIFGAFLELLVGLAAAAAAAGASSSSNSSSCSFCSSSSFVSRSLLEIQELREEIEFC